MSSITITLTGPLLAPSFRFWWLKHVVGFNPRVHCAGALKGTFYQFDSAFAPEIGQVVELDVEPDAIVYACGVSSKAHGGGYEKNFHAPMVFDMSSTVDLEMFNGTRFRAVNAKLLDIPPLPDGFQGLDRSFTTCRNFQFAVAHFGWPSSTSPSRTSRTTMPEEPRQKTARGDEPELIQRYAGSWTMRVTAGYKTVDGKRQRVQRRLTFKGSHQEAKAWRRSVLKQMDEDQFVAPNKVVLGDYLEDWLKTSIEPRRRPNTVSVYSVVVRSIIGQSAIALVKLQQLTPALIEKHLATVSRGNVKLHATVLHSALKKAVRHRLLTTSPYQGIEYAHPVVKEAESWTVAEAAQVIAAAKAREDQFGVYLLLALDTGARRSELDGLSWSHLDGDTLTFERQLDTVTPLAFGPLKNKKVRKVALGAETLAALAAHKKRQLELRFANGDAYENNGLIFAKEDVDRVLPGHRLGQALTTLGEDRFRAFIKAVGVRRLKFHGVRHTTCSMLLGANIPAHVVAARVGNSVPVLVKTYAHSMPTQSRDAAQVLATLLHG